MQKTTFKQSFKQFFMMTASLALAVVLLGGVKAAAALPPRSPPTTAPLRFSMAIMSTAIFSAPIRAAR